MGAAHRIQATPSKKRLHVHGMASTPPTCTYLALAVDRAENVDAATGEGGLAALAYHRYVECVRECEQNHGERPRMRPGMLLTNNFVVTWNGAYGPAACEIRSCARKHEWFGRMKASLGYTCLDQVLWVNGNELHLAVPPVCGSKLNLGVQVQAPEAGPGYELIV